MQDPKARPGQGRVFADAISTGPSDNGFRPLTTRVSDKNFSDARGSLGRHITSTECFEIRRIPCGNGHHIVAKCTRVLTDHTRQSLRNQFAALREVNRITKGLLGNTIPYPLLVGDDGVLFMSEVPGARLSKLLHREANAVVGWSNHERLQNAGRCVGLWLRRFQAASSSGLQPHISSEFMTEVEERIYGCGACKISESVLREVFRRAQELSNSQDGELVTVAAVHGEFLPHNILVDEMQAGVVDFDTFAASGSTYRDFSALLAYMQLLAAKAKYSTRALGCFLKGFFVGYGKECNPVLLQAYVINSLLQIAMEDDANISTVKRHSVERTLREAASENGAQIAWDLVARAAV